MSESEGSSKLKQVKLSSAKSSLHSEALKVLRKRLKLSGGGCAVAEIRIVKTKLY